MSPASIPAHSKRQCCMQVLTVSGASLKPGVLIRGHAGRVRAMAWRPDAPTLLTGSDDQTVRAWRLGDAAAGSGQGGTETPRPPSSVVLPEAAAVQGECVPRLSAAAAAVHGPAAHVAAGAACPGVAAAQTPLPGTGGMGSCVSAAGAPALKKASKGSRQTLGVQPLVRPESHQVWILKLPSLHTSCCRRRVWD